MDAKNYNIYFRKITVALLLLIFCGLSQMLPAQNYALTFDGSNDYINCGNPSGLQITGDQTIEMWIYAYALDARRTPLAKAYAGEGTLTLETNGTINYYYGTGGGNNSPFQTFGTSSQINPNEWTHIAVVRDLSNMKLHWYINGILVNSSDADFTYAQNGSNTFFIGQGYVSDFKGEIDEVRVWNVARTSYEIASGKNSELTGMEDGLAAYWTFNEGSGGTVYDQSPFGHNGSIAGNTSYLISEAPVFQFSPGNEPFEPVPPTGLPYNIVLDEVLINDTNLPIGAQIGVFDGELCVGTAFFDGNPSMNLVAWQADPGQNLAGFTPGNTISFKYHTVWYSEVKNFDASANFLQGNGTFGDGTFSVVELSATTNLAPDATLSTELINFNTVIVNQSSSFPLVISNTGNAILHIDSFNNDDNHFVLSDNFMYVAPGTTDTLWITFTPTAVTAYSDMLTLTSDDPDTAVFEVSLYGTGLPEPTPNISVTPSYLDFGGIAMNTTKAIKLNIFNAGNGDLQVTDITSSNGAFSIFGSTSFTLGQGENRNVAVIFSPTTSGAYSGNLTIQASTGNTIVPAWGVASQGYFTSVAPTGLPYTILAEDIDIDGFRPKVGDEVAAFDDELCVGIGVANSVGKSLQLDGSGDFLINDNSTAFDVQELTISAYVYSSNYNQNGFIFEKGPVNSQYSLFFEGSNINFRTYPAGSSGYDNFYINSASIGISNNTWHFISATYDGTYKRVYVDGVLKASQQYTKTLRTGQVGQIIGAYGGTGSHSYYFNGNIDELRVWDHARTQFEIAEDMSHVLLGNEQGLVGYWNFNNDNYQNLVTGATSSYLNGNANTSGSQYIEIFSNLVFNAWEKDDDLGLPGFTSGNPMTFKVFTEIYDNWVEVDAIADFSVGNGNFGFGQLSVLTLDGTSGLEPDIDVPIENLYVGQITVGESIINEIKVYNIGNAPLHIFISDNSDAFSSAVTDAVINANDSLTFEVTFDPATPGGYTGVLNIESNDPDEPTTAVSLEGFALPAGAANISTSVDMINFGNVETETEKTISFFVINTGTTALSVSNIVSNDASFSVSPTSFTLQNTNDLKEVFVTFTPPYKGSFTSELSITSNATQKQLSLLGVGFDNHFNIVAQTGLPYYIVVEETNLNDYIEAGDELSVFDGELCVGMASIGDSLSNQDVAIIAWEKDDANGLPGFTSGNTMSFKLWTELNGIPTQLDATPTYTIGNGNFGFGQLSIVSLEFGLPEIEVDPMEIFAALNEPDSTTKMLSIQNNGTENLYFRANLDDDPAGRSLSLDGSNDYVALGNLSPGSLWTAEAWVKPSSTPSGRKAIFGGHNSCNDWGIVMSDGGYGISINPPSECSQTVYGSYNGFATAGQWAHVAATCDGTTASLYVNGEFIASAPVLANYTGYSNDVRIGGEACCSNKNFPGLIDEVRLWNYAKSEAEINILMNTSLSGSETGLKAYWNFNDGTATDVSGNGYNGTLQSGASIIAPGCPEVASWVKTPPDLNTVAPGQTVIADIKFYSEGLNDGLYESNIIISNNTINNPNLIIPITLNVTGNPQIEALPPALDFGQVIVNTSSEEEMSFKNIGTQDLIVDDIVLQLGALSSFSKDLTGLSFPFSVPPGDLFAINLSFNPLSPGMVYDSILVISNASNAGTLKVPLSGEGITPPEIFVFQTSFSGTYACNDTYYDSVMVYNIGQENLEFEIAGSLPWISASPASGFVAGGDSVSILINISTLDLFAGQHQAGLLINSNDPDQPVTEIQYSITVTGDPAILTNDFIDFGTGNVGDTLVGELLIANSGCDTLLVSNATIESNYQVFYINNPSFAIPPGDAFPMYISFAPETTLQYSAIITIISNDPNTSALPVVISATGVEPPNMAVSPLTLSSTLQSGDIDNKTISVQNTGGETLNFQAEASSINPYVMALDGTGDYINVVHNDMLNPTSGLTIEAWIYLIDNTNEFVAGKENSGEGKYRLWVNENHLFEFKLNNLYSLTSASQAVKNQWIHLAATFDGETMRIFIDGILDAEQSFDSFTILPNTDNLRIGRSYQYAFFNGKIDEIRLWDIARNQSEIQSTINQALLGTEPELLLYFPLINSTGNIVSDESSNSNNGILYGNPVRQSSTIPFDDYLNLSNYVGGLTAGQTQNINVGINTTGFLAKVYQREILVSGNAVKNPTDLVALSLTIQGSGIITPSPLSLNFDDTFIGLSDTLELIIENTGALAANITNTLFSSSAFYPLNEITKIFPFSQKTLLVVFEPAAIQQYNETLTISLENANVAQVQIPLAGLGVTPPVPVLLPDAVDFGEIVVNLTGTESVELSNTGSSTLEVYNVSFTDGNLFATNLPLPQSLGFGESVIFDVQFTPVNYNLVSSEMIFSTNIGPMALPLAGIGTPPDHDLAIFNVISPLSGCGLSNAESLTVTIQNYGELDQSNFNLGYSLNNGPAVVETLNGTLPSGETVEYTFNQTLNLVSIGTYDLQIFTLLPNDENTVNDTLDSSITNSPSVGDFTTLSPADSSFGVLEPVSFSWDAVPNALEYDLYIWRTNQQKPDDATVSGITNLSYVYYDYLNKNYLYNWQLVAKNQCSSSESEIRLFSFNVFSDLTITEIMIPDSGYSGENVEVSFTISNIGTGGTGLVPWKDNVYISTGAIFNPVTATSVSQPTNMSALSGGNSYTKTVTFDIPDYIGGDYYVFVKTDINNKIQETNENNNTLVSDGTMEIILPPYPDLTVFDVQSTKGTITPGETLSIGWNVENIGDAAAIGGWSQRVSIIAGTQRKILGHVQYTDTLEAGGILSQSSSFTIPEYPGMEGEVYIEVLLTPYPELVEKPNGGINNLALSAESFTLEKVLHISIPQASINENAVSPLQCMIYRSGLRTNALVVNFAVTEPTRISVPVTVTIPANQSGKTFNLSAIDNALIEGNFDVEILAQANGYDQTTSMITVLDNEFPSLFVNLSATEATEGEQFELTVTRDLVTDQAIDVNLSTQSPTQIGLPTTITILANEASASIMVPVTDDNVPELTKDVVLTASKTGFIAGSATITIIDNDIPQVALAINPETVSEAGGPYAAWGTISRLEPGSDPVTIVLSSSPSGQLFFPAQVTIPAGMMEKQFNVGVVDNGVLDGDRTIEVTGAIYLSSCGCGVPEESGGTTTADVTIIDNDGPSLSLVSDPIIVPEGIANAGKLVITRNTLGGAAVELSLSHNGADEIDLPTTATIPEGVDVVEVPFNTLDDGIEDGDQIVSVTVTANEYSSGGCWVMVSDRNLPDYVLSGMELSQSALLINETVDVSIKIKNNGFAPAPEGAKVKIYKSTNNVLDANDVVMSTIFTPSTLPIGDSLIMNKTLTLTGDVGDYHLFATVNKEGILNELIGINNTSEAKALSVLPDYTATVNVEGDIFNGSSPITITGSAEMAAKASAVNKPVDVYVIVGGVRRVYPVTSNENGDFSVTFSPLNGEAGDYQVGACYPNQGLTNAQDSFVLLGAKQTATSYIIWELYQGETQQKFLEIKNLSSLPLSIVDIQVISSPSGCNLNFVPLAELQGNSYATMSYSVNATEVTDGSLYEEVELRLTSSEGTKFNFSAWFYCSATKGNLKLNPVVLSESMVKNQTNYVEFEVTNNGLDETGLITIDLPEAYWLSMASPDTISSLQPGESATATIKLIPGDDLQLNNPITGSIGLSGTNSNSVSLPFTFEPISIETGDLLVDVVDEYTYNTQAAPHLDSAMVILLHPYTGQIIAQGLTDANGHFLVEDVNEGYYTLKVQASMHGNFQDYIFIEKGVVNEKVVFIAFQAITYSWDVIPTVIEDEYEITLVVEFETNVPAPVVLMNMPDTLPHLEQGEYFPFILTLTNVGLITARDVEVELPEDEEYMFTANVDQLDILPQQAVQIPVIMERRPPDKSSGTRSLNCSDITITKYKFECGPDDQLRVVSAWSIYLGRICTSSGGSIPWYWGGGYGPGGPGGGGPGGGSSIGPGTPYQSSNAGCDPCVAEALNCFIDCINPLPPVLDCGADIYSNGLNWSNGISCAWGVVDTFTGGSFGCAWCVGTTIGCFINQAIGNTSPMQGAQGKNTTEAEQVFEDMVMLDKGFVAIENWSKEQAGNDELVGKEFFGTFNQAVAGFTDNEIPIDPSSQDDLIAAFDDTDISEMEILDFVTYWNTTLEARGNGIYSPTPEYPDIIDTLLLHHYELVLDSVIQYVHGRGYPSMDSLFNVSAALGGSILDDKSSSVCATVTVQFSQTLTMTREAFEGTLTVFNGHETDAMENISLNLEVRDEDGVLRNDLFQINTQSLDQISGIDGSGILNALTDGTAVILFIPERSAAPDVPKYYSFGGTLSYLDPFTGEIFEQPLFPVTLQVNPSPNLYLKYFMQRDIFGDDALTEPIEPMIPAELAVMIDNQGAGTAMSVNLESAQPEIIENEKGLLIDFAIVGSNLGGQPVQLGIMDVDFGDIPGGEIAVGQWWFTSTLLGHFISYEASVNHLDSYGNPDLSLVSGIEIHELIKSICVYGPLDDTIHDFLVNDIPDTDDIPDAIHYSNGAIAQVVEANDAQTDGAVTLNDTIVDLTVTPSLSGWNYAKIDDPGNGLYRIISITRDDGQIIPLKNVWLTYSTIPDGGEPIYENKLHFVDDFAELTASTYTIVFEPIDQDVPEVIAINGVPEGPTDTPVQNVEVVFSEPIESTTFTYEDMTLKNQAGPNLMDTLVIISSINDSTYNVDISDKTSPNGYYTLTVQAAGVTDLVGNYGQYGIQVGWLQTIATPAIDYFFGLPEVPGAPIDTLLVLFNMPINTATFTNDKLTLTDPDGNPLSTASLVITSESFNDVLFKISGLAPLTAGDGTYELTFKLTEIQGENGQVGVQDQSVEWIVCQIPLPVANAGSNTSVCDGEPHQLSGTVENAGSILWSTAGDGTFNDAQSLTAIYTPGVQDLDNGTVELSLTAEALNECAAPVTSTLTLTILESPTANAGEDALICENFSQSLFGTVLNANDFTWLSSGDGAFTNSKILTPSYTPGVQDAINGMVEISLVAQPISPCSLADTSSVLISIQQAPAASAGSDTIVCEDQSLMLTAVAHHYSSLTWIAIGDGTFSSQTTLNPVYTFGNEDINGGSLNIYLIALPNSPCFLPAFANLSVEVGRAPFAFAGDDGMVCENGQYTLKGSALYVSSFLWSTNGDGEFGNTQHLNTTYTPGAEDISNGSMQITLTGQAQNPCTLAEFSTMTLSIQYPPEANAGEDATICENESHQLSGSVQNAQSILWQTSGDGTFTDNQALNPEYSPGAMDIQNGSVTLSLNALAVSPCVTDDISTITLVIQALPVSNAGVDAVICENQSYQLSGSVDNATSFQWTSSGDGTFDNAGSLSAIYSPGIMDIQNAIATLTLTVQALSPCELETSSEMLLQITPLATADAGEDATICENQTHELSGIVANQSSFVWESQGDGSFDDDQILSPVYSPGFADIQAGMVNVSLTAQPISPCALSDVSTITLEIQRLPQANAGEDATICENQTHELSGIVANQSSFVWESQGDGTFDDDQILSPVYSPGSADIQAGTVNVSLTTQPISPCALSNVSTITLEIQHLPQANAGEDATICENQTHELMGIVANQSSFVWESQGDGTFDDDQILSPVYSPGSADIQAGTVNVSLTAQPISPCALSDVSTITLEIQLLPIANAGEDATICENQTHELMGIVANQSSFVWESQGDGSFDDDQILSPVYSPGSADIQAGTVNVSLTAQPISPCALSDISIVTLEIQHLPIANAGEDATICENQTQELSGIVANQSTFYWETSGDGLFDDFQLINPVYSPGASDIANGTVEISLTAVPESPCVSTTTSNIEVAIQKLPMVSAGDDQSICHTESVQLSGLPENADGSIWSTSGDGTFDNIADANTVYYPGTNDIANGEAILSLTAAPIAPCLSSSSDGLTLIINYCQDITIPQGWSGISSYVEPVNAEPDSVFDKVMNDLIIMQSQTGIYWPGQNINTIGLWNTLQGYSIKMGNSSGLTMTGSRSGVYTLNLGNGWTILPVLSACDVDVEALFQGTDLTIVKEVAGWKVYWPGLNINSLVNLQSGKSYYVLMNSQGGITFPECVPESLKGSTQSSNIFDELQFMPWSKFESSPNTHIVGVTNNAISESILKKGDLIGVFDQSGACYGVALWDETNTTITIIGDDAFTESKDGFVEGEKLNFRAFVSTTSKEYDLNVVFNVELPNNDGLFVTNGLSLIDDLKLSAVNVTELNVFDVLIYPNPATDKLFIDFDRPQAVDVVLYDVKGQVVLEQSLTELRNQLDISTLRGGVYLIKLEGENIMKTERFIKK